MSEHTPGPWLAEGWSRVRDCSVITANGTVIAGAFYMGGTEQAHANASMLAAALDMYNAIRFSDDAHWTPAMRAAMKKAEGQS